MKKIIIILLALVISFSSFSQHTNTQDSTQIRSTINSFYNWYNKNWQKVAAFKLYTKRTQDPPYMINWKEVERYLLWLRKNAPQLGEEFAKRERLFFRQCDSAFKTQVQDEVPYGFDGDRFTNSQELPQTLIDELKKAKQWVVNIDNDEATVEVLGSYTDKGKEIETLTICFVMKKERAKWTIAQIGCTFAPPN